MLRLPPAAVCLLCRWLLGPIALNVSFLLSHYLIRGHIDHHAWDTSSYRSLIETLIVVASASITEALFSNQLTRKAIQLPIQMAENFYIILKVLMYL